MRSLMAAALCCAVPCAAAAATLRPMTVLHGPIVTLADLFDDAGAQAARKLGPGPDPGQTLVVEAPQLAAIARQFGVDWRPGSPGDRILLQRPGLPLPREAVLAALRSAAQGAAADGDVVLGAFDAPVVAPDAQARADVEQFDLDPQSGRFVATLMVSGTGMTPLTLRLDGAVVAMQSVLVAARRLDRGAPVQPDDLRTARVRAALVHGEPLAEAAQADGLVVRRGIAAGAPVLLADLTRPLAVVRGARVTMILEQPGLAVAALGVAEQDGAVGESIRVLNAGTHAEVLAEVSGPDAVQVAPGSLPLRPADQPFREPARGLP